MTTSILKMRKIVSGLFYTSKFFLLNNRKQNVHIIKYSQVVNENLDLLISKISEAIQPTGNLNHIGEGSNINSVIEKQKGIRFIINAGFNHYRKNFYDWNNQNYNIGDPVGVVKIREHKFIDYLTLDNYGFLLQENRKSKWKISNTLENINHKYILGCTPILIFDKNKINLPNMIPVEKNKINPPSFLGHGNQIHPRTAVGLKDNDLYFFVVENNPENSGGCSLEELQYIGLSINLDSMINLDGGGSSQFKIIEDNGNVISNFISDEDKNRVLGHTLIIFDETLK